MFGVSYFFGFFDSFRYFICEFDFFLVIGIDILFVIIVFFGGRIIIFFRIEDFFWLW